MKKNILEKRHKRITTKHSTNINSKQEKHARIIKILIPLLKSDKIEAYINQQQTKYNHTKSGLRKVDCTRILPLPRRKVITERPSAQATQEQKSSHLIFYLYTQMLTTPKIK